MSGGGTTKILWVEDRPQDVAEAADRISEKFAVQFEYAMSVSSAVRRINSLTYAYIFIDSVIPLDFDAYDSAEGLFSEGATDRVGEELARAVATRKLGQNTGPDELRGIVFCSALPATKEFADFIETSTVPILEWPKTRTYTDLDGAISELELFFDESVGGSRSENVRRSDHTRRSYPEERPQADAGVADGVEASISLKQLRFHIHEQNQMLGRQIGALNAVEVGLRTLAGLRQNQHIDPIMYLREGLEPKQAMWHSAYDKTKGKAANTIQEVEDTIIRLRNALRGTEDIPFDQIKKAIGLSAQQLEGVSQELSNHFATVFRVVQALDVHALARQVVHSLHSTVAANVKILKHGDLTAPRNDPQDVDLKQSLDAIISEYSPEANRRNIDMKRFHEEEDLVVRLVKEDFLTVFNNIIDNAIKHSFEMNVKRAWVSVRTHNSERQVRVSVESWGPEIREQDDIFAQSSRGSAALAVGSGDGLALCSTVCKRNGWEISYTSQKPKNGTTLTRVQGRPAFINTFSVIIRKI